MIAVFSFFQVMTGAGSPWATHTMSTVELAFTVVSGVEITTLTLAQEHSEKKKKKAAALVHTGLT